MSLPCNCDVLHYDRHIGPRPAGSANATSRRRSLEAMTYDTITARNHLIEAALLLRDLSEASHFMLNSAASSAVCGARDLARDAGMAAAHAAQLTNCAFVESYEYTLPLVNSEVPADNTE